MPISEQLGKTVWGRRKFLQAGLAGVGMSGAALAWQAIQPEKAATVSIPPLPADALTIPNGISPMVMLREFDYGTVKREQGRTVREFHMEAGISTLQLNHSTSFVAWSFNGRVPGPTLRVKEGDRVRVIFHNQAGHAHSIHFHGIHKAEVDGVKPVRHGNTTVYEFDAEPYGVHLYHCHTAPVTRHISKGLYGMFIIDPPQSRVPADEMVLIMAGYDTNDDDRNELYAFNGLPNYFMHHPIPIRQDQLIRLYVLNMIEFDPAVSFHLHANMFRVYRTGRSLTPQEETDVITMGTAERHILEFSYRYPGHYMFHPHQDGIAEAGCMGHFEVVSAT